MENSYTIQVNENYEIPLSQEDIDSLDLLKAADGTIHLLKDQVSFHIQILHADFNSKTYTVKVDGKEYHATIGTPLDQLIKKMGFASNGAKNIDSISAPMPGLILDISAKPGMEVKEDEQLLVLEAMKMENIITSPRNGVIKSIAVNQGDVVEKKQLLIEFE